MTSSLSEGEQADFSTLNEALMAHPTDAPTVVSRGRFRRIEWVGESGTFGTDLQAFESGACRWRQTVPQLIDKGRENPNEGGKLDGAIRNNVARTHSPDLEEAVGRRGR
jgi:hypothetical protein